MKIVLFEDDRVAQLYPVSIGRPAFAISCASYRLIDLVGESSPDAHVLVRPHLATLAEADGTRVGVPDASGGNILLVNARLAPVVSMVAELERLASRPKPWMRRRGKIVVAAQLPARELPPPAQLTPQLVQATLGGLGIESEDCDWPIFEYPHDVVRHHLAALRTNLEHRLARGEYRQLSDGVFAAAGAELGLHVVTDTRSGPIVLEEGASVGPFCLLRGPVHIGARARLIEQAAVKDSVAIGHTTKIGGEVEGSIVEPYTNKQHHGFLGHSYLGSWVNLGAGTCNSDLKNTYGFVNMEYYGQRVATGMQFIGTIVGDYAKTAINTGIFTGKTVGTCSMLYGFVTTNVPSFVNYARSFGQVTEAPVDVMVATQARMFARRNVEQRECDIQLLHDMYELTRHERQIAGEPLAL